MAKKMVAKVTWEHKDDGREGYAILIQSGDDWGLDSWYPLTERKHHETGKADYVHWSILQRIGWLQDCGYEVKVDA